MGSTVLFLVTKVLSTRSFVLIAALTFATMLSGTVRVCALDRAPAQELGDPAQQFVEVGDKHLMNEEVDEAIVAYKKAVQALPGNAVVHMRLAEAYTEDANIPAALQEYEQAVRIDPKNARAHARLGWLYGVEQKFKAAIAEEKLALDLDPSIAFAHLTLGLAMTSIGQYDIAVKAFTRAIELDPTDLRAYLNLGTALGRKGDYAGAVSVFQKAISLNRTSFVAHMNLGAAYGKLGERDNQVREFQTAVALQPKSAKAHGKLGWALSQKGEWRGAMREGLIANALMLQTSWQAFLQRFLTMWALVFLGFGALFAFVFSGSRFTPQVGESILKSFFLTFFKDRPGRFVVTTRRLVYVPEMISQWFGGTRVSIEQDQIDRIETGSTISGGWMSIITLDDAVHRFKMPHLVLDPLTEQLKEIGLRVKVSPEKERREGSPPGTAQASVDKPEISPQGAKDPDALSGAETQFAEELQSDFDPFGESALLEKWEAKPEDKVSTITFVIEPQPEQLTEGCDPEPERP